MKRLVMIILVVAAGAFAYTHFFDVSEASAEERALAGLEGQFEADRQRIAQAERSAGAAGLDTTADIEAARRSLERLQESLDELRPRIANAELKQRAERLSESVRELLRRIG